jgi:hypothetical protein
MGPEEPGAAGHGDAFSTKDAFHDRARRAFRLLYSKFSRRPRRGARAD